MKYVYLLKFHMYIQGSVYVLCTMSEGVSAVDVCSAGTVQRCVGSYSSVVYYFIVSLTL